MAAHRFGITRAGKFTVRLGSPGQIAESERSCWVSSHTPNVTSSSEESIALTAPLSCLQAANDR
jgi:hypothetical protein